MLKNYLLDFWYQDFTLMTGLVWLVLLSIVWFLPKNKAWICEPTRVFRRQFVLSHATLADSSS